MIKSNKENNNNFVSNEDRKNYPDYNKINNHNINNFSTTSVVGGRQISPNLYKSEHIDKYNNFDKEEVTQLNHMVNDEFYRNKVGGYGRNVISSPNKNYYEYLKMARATPNSLKHSLHNHISNNQIIDQ